MTRFLRQAVQSDQSNGSHGISRRGGRILQRLAPGRQHAEAFSVGIGLAVEESSRSRIEKPREHRVDERASKPVITQIRGALIRIQTSQSRERIILQHSRHISMLGLRI